MVAGWTINVTARDNGTKDDTGLSSDKHGMGGSKFIGVSSSP
jgi:hypothetical protein